MPVKWTKPNKAAEGRAGAPRTPKAAEPAPEAKGDAPKGKGKGKKEAK